MNEHGFDLTSPDDDRDTRDRDDAGDVELDSLCEEVYRARKLAAMPQSLRGVAAYRARTRLQLARARQRALDV